MIYELVGTTQTSQADSNMGKSNSHAGVIRLRRNEPVSGLGGDAAWATAHDMKI